MAFATVARSPEPLTYPPPSVGWPIHVCREITTPYVTPVVAPAPAVAPATSAPPPTERELLEIDALALSLRAASERTTVPLAAAAAAFVASDGWSRFGFARLDDYARERLARSGRWVRDLAALGARLSTLPRLAAALVGEDGGAPIGRVAAMLVAKVASAESLPDWIDRARALSIRDLRDAIAFANVGAGDAPEEPATVAATRDAACTIAVDAPDDPADRALLRMAVPEPVVAAFDESLDLFRAVEGREGTVAAFIEALIAEHAAGSEPHDLATAVAPAESDLRVLESGPLAAAAERALSRSTARWAHLPAHRAPDHAGSPEQRLAQAGVTLHRLRSLSAEAGQGGALDLDRQLRALIALEHEIEVRLGALLATLGDRRAWPRLRFAGVGHYGEERLRLGRTAVEDVARLARRLRELPVLRAAYESGRVGREAAALVAQHLLHRSAPGSASPAGRALEASWVARAEESTIKRMRDEARALARARMLGAADGPAADGPATDPRAADRRPRRPCAPFVPLDDATWWASLRRDPGIALERVERLGALTLSSPDVFQARPLEVDAWLRLRLPIDLARAFLATVDAERRRLATAADAIPWDADPEIAADRLGRSPSRVAARMFSIRCRRLPAWVALLSLLEEFAATWDASPPGRRRPDNEIYARAGWRCEAPGCTSRCNLEAHHLVYRSRGGGDDDGNLICACRFHHQQGEHGGLARCRGVAPLGVTWRLGCGDATIDGVVLYRNERRLPVTDP